MNAPARFTSALLKAQETVIREDECYSCGKFSVMADTNYRHWRDNMDGEIVEAYVCDKCIRRGWDQWGRP